MDVIQKAIVEQEQLLEAAIAADDQNGQAHAYDNLAQIYLATGQYQKALEYCKRFSEITKAIGDKVGEAMAYYSLGSISEAQAIYHQAIGYYEKSLSIATEESDHQLQGMAHFKIGNVYRKKNDYINAIKHHEKSLGIAKENGDKEGEGRSYSSLGQDSYMMGDFVKAIEKHKQHLSITKTTSNQKEEGIACKNLGCAYFGLGKYDQALEYHEKCLKIAKDRADIHEEGCAYTNLGLAFEQLARFKEAIKYHERSLEIATRIGDKHGEGMCYGNISNAHLNMGNLQMAFDYAQKDLKIAMELEDRHGEGSACGNLGIVCNMLGKPEEAIQFLLRHLQITKELHDRQGEMKAYGNLGNTYSSLGNYELSTHYYKENLNIAKNIHAKHSEAKAYSNLGGDYILMGKYIDAIEIERKALDAAKEFGDRKLEGITNGNLGMCYERVGQNQEAKLYFTKYLEIAMETEDKIGEANAHQNLGDICYILGKEDDSFKHYEASLSIAISTGRKKQQAQAYGSLGNWYGITRGDFDNAVKYHQKDLEIAVEINDKDGESRACTNIGNAYLFLGKYDNAQKNFERSLQIAKEIDDKHGEAAACLSLGTCCYHLSMRFKESGDERDALGAMKQSEGYLLDSIKCNEWLFHNLKEEDQFKISIVDTYINSYRWLTGVYIAMGETEKALLVSEKKRGQALEDILKEKYSLQKGTSGDLNFLNYADIRSKVVSPFSCLAFYSELLNPALNNVGENESAIGAWVLDSESPHVHFQRKTYTELRSLVKKGDSLDANNSTLDELIDNAYTTMSVRGTTECEDRSIDHVSKKGKRNVYIYDEELDEDILENLYDALVAPIEDKLTQDEIIIIPEGSLFKVPFAALKNPQTKVCLSEKKRIRLAPSLTTLKILKESTSADSHCMTGALIVGDPDVTGERMYKGEKTNFDQLPNARREAESIAKVLGVTPVTGTLATKQAIKKRLQEGVAVIHFAAHGSVDRGEIVLSPCTDQMEAGQIPDEKDYLLTINEVQEIGLRAKLVVLSCCHSGRGEIKSEGVVGMTRAFFAAGALAVVASLWAVDDRGTRVFMEKFYAHLKRGEKASVSLQEAMKEMREIERYSKPMFWAPFFLMGEDVTINMS